MWSFRPYHDAALQAFQAEQSGCAYSYAEVGATAGEFPAGYDHDRNFAVLGHGPQAYAAAVRAVQQWVMFPQTWVRVFPGTPPTLAQTVVLQFHLLGLYWKSAARVLYLVEQTELPDGTKARFGFAYGTLPGHVERGEERFTVVWRADDSVVYELQAFSQPRYWMARLAKPLTRRWQRRFVKDSQSAMRHFVEHELA